MHRHVQYHEIARWFLPMIEMTNWPFYHYKLSFYSLMINHCRWWLQPWNKRHLLLGRKVITKLESTSAGINTRLPGVCFTLYKSHMLYTVTQGSFLSLGSLIKRKFQLTFKKKMQRHYLSTKVHLVKAMVFPVVMYGCENWTIKKAEHRRIDAFEPWSWRRLLRVPWTARRSIQSMLRSALCVYWKDWCWSWNSNVLATWCDKLTHWKRPWCWGAGGEGNDRGWDGLMASLTQWTRVWVNSGSFWWTGRPGVLRVMGSQRVGHNWATELNWYYLL